MLSIQTNVNSLVAQQNLNVNSAFQSKTIQQLTSGYRINSSGDDAAGLAVANKFRNSVAELTQGVANGNDGVAQLQIMDGGMSNISKILDRLKTLAMQSSSASFTSSRTPLNAEFQTDIAEIDRQAQSIGLNTNGTFAKSLGIYLGAGTGSGTGSVQQTNSTVNVDLSKATVDSQSLGLTGMQTGNTGFDLSTSEINLIKANTGANSEATTGFALFKLSGPGFNGASVSVALGGTTSGVLDGASLASAINTAITQAGVSNSNLAAAGITASVVTDAGTGHQVLQFSSAHTGFQVAAGDVMANAFLGNASTSSGAGNTLTTTLQSVYSAANSGNFAGNDPLRITVEGGGLSGPQTFSITATGGASAATTGGLIAAEINSGTDAQGLAFKAAGITASGSGPGLTFTSASGQDLKVSVAGDVNNMLGLGSYLATEAPSITAGAWTQPAAVNQVKLDLSLGGGTADTLTVAGNSAAGIDDTEANTITTINNAIAGKSATSAWKLAGIQAVDNSGAIELISTNGSNFRLGVRNTAAGTNFGFYADGNRSTVGAPSTGVGSATSFTAQTSAGSYQLGSVQSGVNTATPISFSAINYSVDKQALTLAASDVSGNQHTLLVSLDSTNAKDIDQAIASINSQIQGQPDTTLKGINAIKVNSSGEQTIEFQSSVQNFSLAVGGTATGAGLFMGTGQAQNRTLASLKIGTGGAADISTQTNAIAAVQAITSAVAALGTAQAAVGKGENQLSYAINLAQSQITNFASAESQIRDTDVAQQAANLSKAQVLQQASIAAMAQANSAPQAVLSLLKG